jgi:Protein of unknown function (DUF3108)
VRGGRLARPLTALAAGLASLAAGAGLAAACPDAPALTAGEALSYELAWSGITAGRATLTIGGRTEVGGRLAVPLVADATSSRFVDAFYKVRIHAESLLDCRGRYSHRFVHRAEEGRRRRDRVYTFDVEQQEVRREQAGEETQRFPLALPAHDPFTTLYEVRTRPLEVGRPLVLETFEGKRRWDVEVQVLRRERVTVPAGTFDTIVVRPLLSFEGVFQQKGELLVWLTDDVHRMPVKMASTVRIGSVTAELTSFVRPAP